MTKDAINQAMAELDGWKLSPSAGYKWTSPDGKRELRLPHDYTEDLNAVARVVEKLSPDQWRQYRANIIRSCLESEFEIDPIDATALQRCEAILRAVGKWVDS